MCADLEIDMEHKYSEAGDEEQPHGRVDREKNKHKEEEEGRRKLNEADRRKIAAELEKYAPPSTSSIKVSITSATAKGRPTQ